MAALEYDKLEEGMELPELTKDPIEHVQLVRYAGASGDFNQIHTVPAYAKKAGLDDIIAHGMLIMGMLGQMITNYAGVKPVKKYSVSFKNMTRLGDVLTAKGMIKRKYEDENGKFIDCKVNIQDQNGEVKVAGKVTFQCD